MVRGIQGDRADISPSRHAIETAILNRLQVIAHPSSSYAVTELNGMTSSPLSLSLRPSPSNEAASAEQLTLAHVLARITTEYGPAFANVTEDKLQAQTAASLQYQDVEMENAELPPPPQQQSTDDTAKLVSREELIKIVQVAFEESSLAQDFISLLLSSVRPAAAGASMSPTLKAAVPMGALGGAAIFAQQAKTDMAVSIGWKKSAIEAASQSLLAAADRLVQNSGETSKFVDGVLKIRAAGWAIVQMPAGGGDAQQGALKVFYGFQKAGSDFHDPGVGYLKESASGDLAFSRDSRFADKKYKTLRVRIQSKDGTASSFSGPKDYSDKELSEIEIELYRARDALFDEELYHELTKEARVISNSGVVITETEIQIPLPDGSKVSIDLIDPEITERMETSLGPTVILLALHTLLSHAHHLNLKKRQEIPEPLSVRKPQVRPMVLLRPLLAFATHSNLLNLAESYFRSLLNPFKSAQLPCSLSISRFSNLENLSKSTSPSELVEQLLSTPQSTLTLYLPHDSQLSLYIQTPYQHSQTTYQWIPPFTFKTSSPSSPDGEISFDALSDAESPIVLAVQESLSATIHALLGPTWRKLDHHEFVRDTQHLRMDLLPDMAIIVTHNGQEKACINTSLQDVLASIPLSSKAM